MIRVIGLSLIVVVWVIGLRLIVGLRVIGLRLIVGLRVTGLRVIVIRVGRTSVFIDFGLNLGFGFVIADFIQDEVSILGIIEV